MCALVKKICLMHTNTQIVKFKLLGHWKKVSECSDS